MTPRKWAWSPYPGEGQSRSAGDRKQVVASQGARLKRTPHDRSEESRDKTRWPPCKDSLRGKCTNPSCNLWHPPVCYNYMRLMGSPAKKRKVAEKEQWLIERDYSTGFERKTSKTVHEVLGETDENSSNFQT